MNTLVLLQAVAVALLLISAVESFRPHAWWPRSPIRPVARGPARGTAPRERRWIHTGLALVLGANLLGVQLAEREGSSAAGVAALVLLAVGAVTVVVGLVRGPSKDDLARFATEGGGASADDGEDAPR